MNIEEVREYCLSKPGATEDAAFGPQTVLFRLCNKIFACLDLSRPNLVVLKMDAERALVLRERYHGVIGAWHWNKKYWSDVFLDRDVDEALVKELLDSSYELVRQRLPKKTLFNFPDLPKDWKHLHYPVVDSAMNVVRNLARTSNSSDYFLVTADYQTAGRGQGTNTWESEDKKNLLFAFRFYPQKIKAVQQFLVLQCISVAIAMALEKYCHRTIKIKWPNDIYCEDQKICGILIEHDLCGQYLTETRCGIGININQQCFTGDAPNPVSLFQLLGKEVDRAAVLRNFILHFQRLYHGLLRGEVDEVLAFYRSRLYRLQGWYPFRDIHGVFEAHIDEVLSNGCLVLVDRNHHKKIYAHKEVEYLLNKKEYVPTVDEINEWTLFKRNE